MQEMTQGPWREHLKKAPKPGITPLPIAKKQVIAAWTTSDSEIRDDLKGTILRK